MNKREEPSTKQLIALCIAVLFAGIAAVIIFIRPANASDGAQVPEQLYTVVDEEYDSFKSEPTGVSTFTMRTVGMTTSSGLDARYVIVKFEFSDVLYITCYQKPYSFTPLLNDDGTPMTYEQFHAAMEKVK